jgi:hypothetical protein
MTIYGHDPFSWPYLVIAQRFVFKGSINSKERTLGALFGSGSEAVTITYGKLVLFKLASIPTFYAIQELLHS